MKKNILFLFGILAFLSFPAFSADNLGQRAEEIGNQVNMFTTTAVYVSTLLGIVCLIIGGFNIKKHGDNPQQVPLSRPLIFLAAGSILFGLGATSDTLQASLFGTGRDSGNSSGTFDDFSS